MARRMTPLTVMILIVLTCGLAFVDVQAEEFRHHDVHQHGVAHLNVAVEGDSVYIEFSSPAANIVGFEHHPSTQEQKKSIRASIENLKAGDEIFKLSKKAQGKLKESAVDTDIAIESNPESHAGHSNEHGKEHHHADDHERHSEFKAKYRFVCKRPDKLTQIEVMLFRIFPGIEQIEVQILTNKKQTALELTPKKNKIVF